MSVTITPGVDQTQVVGSVIFDYKWFQRRYPEIAEWCDPDMAEGYFDLATEFCDNSIVVSTGCRQVGSPIREVPKRQRMLGLLTAHIATLFAPINGQPPSALVGRISNAGEGSVNVAVDFPDRPGAEWYAQTKYGAMYWAATARYRMARYYPGQQQFAEYPYSFANGRGRFGGW